MVLLLMYSLVLLLFCKSSEIINQAVLDGDRNWRLMDNQENNLEKTVCHNVTRKKMLHLCILNFRKFMPSRRMRVRIAFFAGGFCLVPKKSQRSQVTQMASQNS